ncbi:hypothetical protein CHS0354_011814 [Potamilus streckersoni]|uniref:Uncharacterized protein n=1 Tax=Potamilus streckersoni TaxID=2493646 RepID=A0AAE0WE28_9BIVA|nr:hypothetical protein CHS0354_011814 [Potamilus streckersoni]
MKFIGSFGEAIIILVTYAAICVRMQHVSTSNAENIIIQIGERLYLAFPVDGTEKTYLLPIQIGVGVETSTITPELTLERQEVTSMKWISDQVGDVGSAGIKRPFNDGSQSLGSIENDTNLVNRSTILREVLLPNWNIVHGQQSLNTNNMKVTSDVTPTAAGFIASTGNEHNWQTKSKGVLLLIAKGKQFQSSYMRHDLRLPHALRGTVRISPDMGERILKRKITQNNASDTDKEGSHNFTTSSGHFTISKVKTPDGHWHIAIKSESANEAINNKTEMATLAQDTKSNNSSISIKDS